MATKDDKVWVGFDLGGTKMLAAVFNDRFEVLGREKKKTRARDGEAAGLKLMEKVIDDALADAGVNPKVLAGIGMGCPGPLDLDKGILLDTPNLGWKNLKLKAHFEKRYGCPVAIGNDVDMGTYGEYCFGSGEQQRCVLGIFPGTGVGGGCVYEGKIFRGRMGSCMEVGHMVLQPEGPASATGVHGTLESLCSRLTIAQGAIVAAYRGQAPYLLSEGGTDITRVRSGLIARSVKAGDTAVIDLVQDAARWLGVGIGNLVNVLSPDVVVLGGGLIDALPDLMLDAVRSSCANTVMPAFRTTYKIVEAQLGDDAGIMGSAAWVKACVEGASV